MGKVSDLYCGERPEFIRPGAQEKLPEELRYSPALAKRLANALAESKRSFDANQEKIIRNTWAKAAMRMGLPFDPAATLKDQDPRL